MHPARIQLTPVRLMQYSSAITEVKEATNVLFHIRGIFIICNSRIFVTFGFGIEDFNCITVGMLFSRFHSKYALSFRPIVQRL